MDDGTTGRLERIRRAIEDHQGRLIAFAWRITGDLESARDVVQETFLRLCRQDLDAIDDHLPAWLFRVCRNRALDVRKKERPMRPLPDTADPPDAAAADPHEQLERTDGTARILTALSGLPATQQEALRLRFQEELSYKQISAVTGHSVSHVGVLIHDGIRTIRRRLDGAGGTHD
jgi:RNA polymerase sigma-70 factor (ECF subfamily)